jgi:CubicO group peptidase (beta-lactamase class C family)
MTTLTAQNTVAWHDRTTDQHKALVDDWADKGFRTLSLSIYGTPQDPRYAAVMVKRPAVIATKAYYSRTQAGIQDAFDEMARQGWGPYILTATGPAAGAVFAAVFTPMAGIPLTRLSLTGQQFSDLNDAQQAAGRTLLWADAFGTPEDTRYTAIWGPNPEREAWNADALDEGGAELQARFDAMTASWARPAHVSVTPAGRHLEVFVDSVIGPWASKVAMTSEAYQAEFTARAGEGLFPIRVSASGAGAGARFAAIFAKRDRAEPRTFRASGPSTLAAVDAGIEAYMRDRNLRGVSLAVARGTRLVYAKGYTFAEASYPDLQPTTPFRQASVSKTFLAAATWRLIQQGQLALDTTLQSVLALTQPDGSAPKDARFAAITVRHLLESTSGVRQGLLWKGVEAAQAANAALPATHRQLARYIAAQDLTAAPGTTTNVAYGNTDTFLLSQVVAARVGASSFEAALKQLVLDPLRMTRTRGSRSLAAAQAADEARYHTSVYNPENGWPLFPLELGRSVKSPDRPLVASHYGGYDYELFDGCGGLSAATIDVARLCAMFSDRSGNPVLAPGTIDAMLDAAVHATTAYSGPDAHGYHGLDWAQALDAANHRYRFAKGGWLPAMGTSYRCTTGGFTYVIAQNGNPRKDSTANWLDNISAAVQAHDWGSTDLFPQFGMPSLAAMAFQPVPDLAIPARFSPIATLAREEESMAAGSGVRTRVLPGSRVRVAEVAGADRRG